MRRSFTRSPCSEDVGAAPVTNAAGGWQQDNLLGFGLWSRWRISENLSKSRRIRSSGRQTEP